MSSPTVPPNWLHTGSLSNNFLPPSLYLNIPESFSSTKLFDSEWPNNEISSLLNMLPSPTSLCSGSKMLEPLEIQMQGLKDLLLLDAERLADAGTRDSVPMEATTVHMHTSVPSVATPVTLLLTAPRFLREGRPGNSAGTSVETLLYTRLTYTREPGKPSYDTPKSFRPIVLLNTMGKLLEKMLANRLQFEAAEHGVLHPNQFGGVRQNSTEDAGCFLLHVVRAGWQAGLKTSVVAFDLAQFFPSINHELILSILEKQGFAPEIVVFFRSYLVGRHTQYAWDEDLSPAFPSSVGLGQGSAMSPVISALTLAPLMKEFERRVASALLISFVDDSTIMAQSLTLEVNLPKLV
jgi:hypothetical protein